MDSLKVSERHSKDENFLNKFRFTDVVGSLEIQEDSKPFKKLKFENTEEIKIEVVNDKEFEISEIVSEISMSFEEPKEREGKKTPHSGGIDLKNKQNDQKTSPKSKKSEKFSTIYTLSSDSSKVHEEVPEEKGILCKNSQIFEEKSGKNNKENFPTRSKEYLEFLPSKKFCKKCKCEVQTTIKMEMPTMPL